MINLSNLNDLKEIILNVRDGQFLRDRVRQWIAQQERTLMLGAEQRFTEPHTAAKTKGTSVHIETLHLYLDSEEGEHLLSRKVTPPHPLDLQTHERLKSRVREEIERLYQQSPPNSFNIHTPPQKPQDL